MEYLGLDIWMEILSRLVVKDLIRFKSVSKAFLDLISKDDFIRLHLNKSSFRAIPIIRPSYLNCLKQHGGEEVGTMFYGESYGSCNGLVCLLPLRNYNKYAGGVLLWNPALHQAEYIPIKRPLEIIYSSWFGYDIDEYKLVLGTASHIHLIRLYIDTDSCKSSLKIDKNYVHCDSRGTLVHRTVHWPAYDKADREHTIISYDLRNETIGRIATPDGMTYKFHTFVLGQVDGCLSTMFTKHSHVELWVMKEYGVEETWTKLKISPLGMLFTYRENVKEPYDVELDDPTQLCSSIYGKDVYVESLISPRSIKPRRAD